MATTPTTTEPEVTDAQKKRAAYSAAETRLKDKYSDEFKALVQEEARERGVVYTFRKTEEEKAAETLADLLAKHPGLAAKITTVGEPFVPSDDVEPEPEYPSEPGLPR